MIRFWIFDFGLPIDKPGASIKDIDPIIFGLPIDRPGASIKDIDPIIFGLPIDKPAASIKNIDPIIVIGGEGLLGDGIRNRKSPIEKFPIENCPDQHHQRVRYPVR